MDPQAVGQAILAHPPKGSPSLLLIVFAQIVGSVSLDTVTMVASALCRTGLGLVSQDLSGAQGVVQYPIGNEVLFQARAICHFDEWIIRSVLTAKK